MQQIHLSLTRILRDSTEVNKLEVSHSDLIWFLNPGQNVPIKLLLPPLKTNCLA